LDSALLNKLQ